MMNSNLPRKAIPRNLGKKFSSLSFDAQKRILEELHAAVFLGIKVLVIENIDPKYKDELEKIIKTGTEDDLFMFGYEKIPDFNRKYVQLIDDIKNAFINSLP